ncbi:MULTISPECIES: hypothetical protein [Pseudomonas]|uniref:hypothetical protein n=1 Tax=Pseudomonas TaxID=286 RepID=UPI000E316504|nr:MULTISPECIES: hypothetical protein [Pseudomonas]BBN60918.1 hypothetical protein KUIN1_01080 [Pseudomonas sp. KUIN-1]
MLNLLAVGNDACKLGMTPSLYPRTDFQCHKDQSNINSYALKVSDKKRGMLVERRRGLASQLRVLGDFIQKMEIGCSWDLKDQESIDNERKP